MGGGGGGGGGGWGVNIGILSPIESLIQSGHVLVDKY